LSILVGLALFLMVATPGPARADEPDYAARAMFSALRGQNIDLMLSLKNGGVDPNLTLDQAGLKAGDVFGGTTPELLKTNADVQHWPLLTWAVCMQATESVRLLLKWGAEVNAADGQGVTPLHWAAWTGNYPLVKMLIRAEADPRTEDRLGRTPLDWGLMNGQDDVVRLLIGVSQ